MQRNPRILIAGTHSGVGKTTLSTAIMAALTANGYTVQPYKIGPDYIDPGYHTAATGRVSRNLDCWMLGEDTVRELFIRSAVGADISVVEGVMGLYDGMGSTSSSSSAHVAKILDIPVLLVLDVRSMANSAAAVVLGFKNMDPQVNICGVILNHVGSERHFRILKDSIEKSCRVPVVGHIHRHAVIELPERHLGLLPTAEKTRLSEHIQSLAGALGDGIDLGRILELAGRAETCPTPVKRVFPVKNLEKRVRIGLFQDAAFNFYYRDGLDFLEAQGAELVKCSPLADRGLPDDIHGLYVGGGFPEMFLENLSKNSSFIENLRAAVQYGMPLYAECGGLMYLSSSIIDFTGQEYPVAGILSGRCRMEKRRAALGYVTATSLKESILCSRGTALRGHEFHYSTLELLRNYDNAYRLDRWGEPSVTDEGVAGGNVLASYVHLHFAGCPEAASGFLRSCIHYKEHKIN